MKFLESILIKKEMDALIEFKKTHKCSFTKSESSLETCTAIGGLWEYRIVPNNIGTAVSIHCVCGESKDVTDYKSW